VDQTKGELLTFADSEAVSAVAAISDRRPQVVALERRFAESPRGAALINRIKADKTLSHAEIRIVSHDSDEIRVLPRTPAPGRPPGGAGGGGTATTATAQPAATATAAPLDQRGTRRAPRFKIAAKVDVHVDGKTATLIDLSAIGAQVVSATILKPNQRVRMALTDEAGDVRFSAAVAWASFEIPPNTGPRYRAGIEFVDADAPAVDAFCARHKA
jgi:hypothetical protein